MYRSDISESIVTVKTVFSSGYNSQNELLYFLYKLGLIIIKNNLAISHSKLSYDKLKLQYEGILGTKLEDPPHEDLNIKVDPTEFDLLGGFYEDNAHANGTRKGAGEFYSPAFVVDYMVDALGLEDEDNLLNKKFIDISCGTGAFLTASLKKVIHVLRTKGTLDSKILQKIIDNFYGLDISSTACEACKINLYLVLLNELGPEALLKMKNISFNIYCSNSIDNVSSEKNEIHKIKYRLDNYCNGFDFILGNPPYLEAKKMPTELKDACRASWPRSVKGAFDLYIPFVLQCNRLVAEGGKICLILPNKFTVANYAMELRKILLNNFTLIELTDLSEMDIFNRAMVYPILLSYKKGEPSPYHTVKTRMSIKSQEELKKSNECTMVPQGLYSSIDCKHTIFSLPAEGKIADMLGRIFTNGEPISKYINFRSTVSFHEKGLRERFVRQSFDDDISVSRDYKYLGGRSYAHKNEVGLFRFFWQGYYINYDQEKLLTYNNVLPPLSHFQQEKIVLCQHAPRIIAAFDKGGEFVTKDVYPIGIATIGLKNSPMSVAFFAMLLNSELMSFIYGTVYKGIQIGGGYYHYLPTWLDVLPVIVPDKKDIKRIERIADRMTWTNDYAIRLYLMSEADSIFYRIYSVNEEQQAVIRRTVPAWNPRVS